MLYIVVTNIGTNIALLLFLAQMLTKIPFFREILLLGKEQERKQGTAEERSFQSLRRQLIAGMVFSTFCIISDWIGIQVQGALPNARVIGILSAGFLGGPVSGIFTAIVAAVHRYMIFPTRISTFSCVVSALLQGGLAAGIAWKRRDIREYTSLYLVLITFVAELIHILLILALTRPFGSAVQIVCEVIIPMACMNSIGMVLFFGVFRSIYHEADLKAASTVSLALRVAEKCTPYLNESFFTEESAGKVIEIIMQEYGCQGAAIVQGDKFLGKSEAFRYIDLKGGEYPKILIETQEKEKTVLGTGSRTRNVFSPLYEEYAVLSSPVRAEKAGEFCILVLLFTKNKYSYQADTEFTSGLARFFATQLKLSDMEKQKKELQKAQITALQSQINPHFLFNALNTISCFCREKPERARELLMALSSYFRNMLRDVDYMVPLEREMEHVRAYVMLEEGRFEERLQVTIEETEESGGQHCSCIVPSLILQPIVENAIRHGAIKRERGKVWIRIRKEDENIVIDVEDNGPGMDKEQIRKLYEEEGFSGEGSGGIGMKNVQMRLTGIFGKEYGLQVRTEETGTTVRMKIPVRFRQEEWKQEGAV